MSDGAFRVLALAGLLLVVVAVVSVLASWAWRMRRAGADFTPPASADGPASGSAGVPPADRGEYRGVPADPGTYASMPSGLPGPYGPGPSHAEPQPATYHETTYRAAHRVHEPHTPASRPLPDASSAYGRHHAPDPPPDWPPYQR